MRVIHLLRKFDPAEWGGTETAVQHLTMALRQQDVTSVMYCPRLNGGAVRGLSVDNPCTVKRFKARMPVWGISRQKRRQLVAMGGNLMSFDLLPALWHEPEVSVVHTHTLGRLGGIGATAARIRHLPFVVTIHGGLFDLPTPLKTSFNQPDYGGLEWGKIFGWLFQSRHLLDHADAILTCNPKEAGLLRELYPNKRIQVQAHGIPTGLFQRNHRATARDAFPEIYGRQLLLCVGRIDAVKNQEWLIDQAAKILRDHPQAILVFVGACTDFVYGNALRRRILETGLGGRVLLVGSLPADDPHLIGLFQEAQAVIMPSISETFGLVILEAWAAGATVISSRTSGASALIDSGRNGWLFDLERPAEFHQALRLTLDYPQVRAQLGAAGNQLVNGKYDVAVVAAPVKQLYEELVEAKHALRHTA